ncbi:MAG: hypothetical protein PVG83_09950 [Acidimicrobiia bacterium]|jgi:hypothetical protein
MARFTRKLIDRALGTRDVRGEGIRRTLHGLRLGDRRELYLGLSLTAIAYLQRTRPRRRLIYREQVPPGSAVVVHHKRRGDPAIEVIKP